MKKIKTCSRCGNNIKDYELSIKNICESCIECPSFYNNSRRITCPVCRVLRADDPDYVGCYECGDKGYIDSRGL